MYNPVFSGWRSSLGPGNTYKQPDTSTGAPCLPFPTMLDSLAAFSSIQGVGKTAWSISRRSSAGTKLRRLGHDDITDRLPPVNVASRPILVLSASLVVNTLVWRRTSWPARQAAGSGKGISWQPSRLFARQPRSGHCKDKTTDHHSWHFTHWLALREGKGPLLQIAS